MTYFVSLYYVSCSHRNVSPTSHFSQLAFFYDIRGYCLFSKLNLESVVLPSHSESSIGPAAVQRGVNQGDLRGALAHVLEQSVSKMVSTRMSFKGYEQKYYKNNFRMFSDFGHTSSVDEIVKFKEDHKRK